MAIKPIGNRKSKIENPKSGNPLPRGGTDLMGPRHERMRASGGKSSFLTCKITLVESVLKDRLVSQLLLRAVLIRTIIGNCFISPRALPERFAKAPGQQAIADSLLEVS